MNKNPENKNNWQEFQDGLAESKGLAIVLLEEDGLSYIHASNNNSICRNLTASKEFAQQCERFCGKVYSKAVEEGNALKYKCHAGLECIAVPIKNSEDKNLVAITGRAFAKSADYRKARERAITGDWSEFPPSKFFENYLMTISTQNIEDLAKRLTNMSEEEKKLLYNLNESEIPANLKPTVEGQKLSNKKNGLIKQSSRKRSEELKEANAWRSLFSSLLDLSYKQACFSILEFLKERYAISSMAWLEVSESHFESILAIGGLKKQKIKISMPTDDKRLVKAIRENSSVELRERKKTEDKGNRKFIKLFPITVGGRIQSALILGDKLKDEKINQQISKFCRTIAPELEILRLREELSHRSWLGVALHKFNESLKMIDTEDFWSRLMQTIAEVLQAERGSLFVYDETKKILLVKSAIGTKADFIKNRNLKKSGKRIIEGVWKSGNALAVPSIAQIGLLPAPADWKYKSESFICFPITIADKKIGVLNLTDKIGGRIYDDFDLRLLNSIAPQIAVAIDRTNLKNRAGEFEQLSVTDPLTGLLNRRYLEARLQEELKRSNRHGFQMSFMMIDVDNFKAYNDTYSHPEGDKALKIVGHTLKKTLRGADVASRYGGEEFSILLPQTNIEEALTIAERIRKNVEDTEFPNRQVTVSIGIVGASLKLNTPEDLILAADKALFIAKDKGRNNVQIYGNGNSE
ncbi:MAG: diguanylate cyclase [Acidobacteriota bacterium]|jgi:diguanylate cyclase (GGDEF)-like protein|nr:diguanylate cyclase [Acidobacteriota bacterium]